MEFSPEALTLSTSLCYLTLFMPFEKGFPDGG